MNIRLNDNTNRLDFAPLTLTRPIGNLRMGIMTNDERWAFLLPEVRVFYKTDDYLQEKFPDAKNGIEVDARIVPNQAFAKAVTELESNASLWIGEEKVAWVGEGTRTKKYDGELPVIVRNRWGLYMENDRVLQEDYALITAGRVSEPLTASNRVIGDASQIFLEKGARIEGATLNTTNGPVYVGENAEIMEGSLVRGPFAMSNDAVLKMGAKIYGPVSVGPYCKIGGEVGASIFYGYSNKGHEGYLGNSLIGEWCNLGADTNTSNLKNNYGKVKTYSYRSGKQEQTDIQFMGLTMGDHSKCGINTMFNTATVVGVSSNIFSAGFPDKFIPSFRWGVQGDTYAFDKALESANNMMIRRKLTLSDTEIAILRYIADRE